MKNIKIFAWVFGAILVLFLMGYLYSTFFKPTYGSGNVMGILLFGLVLGAVIAFLVFKLVSKSSSKATIAESSHTVVESMRKVFKIVCAEGQFHEIYNYEATKKLFKIIPSTKKALVIVQAKVLIGYDFEKCVWETDEENKKLKIISFPEPEILSMETEYKYYYFEEDLFNFIKRDDLHEIQSRGKEQVRQAALNSGLRQIASEQMRTMLTEMVTAYHWQLENSDKIKLPAPKTELPN